MPDRPKNFFVLPCSHLLRRAAAVSLRSKIMGMAAGAVLATGGIGIIQAHRILAVALSGDHPVIDHIVRQMLYSLLAGIILTMLAAAGLTWAITRPVLRLLEGSRTIRQELCGLDPKLSENDGEGKRAASKEEMLWDTLSPREREVMTSVAHGHTSRQIGEKSGLREKTVATYRSRSMAKLGISGRAERIKLTLHLGILDAGDKGAEQGG